MKLNITSGKWRCSPEFGLITVSPEGTCAGSDTICDINKNVSFDYTGREAIANMMAIAELPTLIKLALQGYVYHERISIHDEEYRASSEYLRNSLKFSLSSVLNVEPILLATWVSQLAELEDIPINKIKFL